MTKTAPQAAASTDIKVDKTNPKSTKPVRRKPARRTAKDTTDNNVAHRRDDVAASNRAVWDFAFHTPERHTKRVAYGSFAFTNVDAQYVVQRATELWGPHGDRWGLKDLNYSTIEAGGQTSLVLHATLFYPGTEGTAEFPVAVDMEWRHGSDVHKKLATVARSKALSLLGFAADAYMGLFDDRQYVEENRRRFAAPPAPEKVAARVDKAMAAVSRTTTLDSIELMAAHADKLREDGEIDDVAHDKIKAAIKQRRTEIRTDGGKPSSAKPGTKPHHPIPTSAMSTGTQVTPPTPGAI